MSVNNPNGRPTSTRQGAMAHAILRPVAGIIMACSVLMATMIGAQTAHADNSPTGTITVTSPDLEKIKLSTKGLKAYRIAVWDNSSITMTSDGKKIQKFNALSVSLDGSDNNYNNGDPTGAPSTSQAIAEALNKLRANTCTDPNALNDAGAYVGTCDTLTPAQYLTSSKFKKDDEATFAQALDLNKLPQPIMPTADSNDYASAKWEKLTPGLYMIKATDPSASNDYPLLIGTMFYPDGLSDEDMATGVGYADGVSTLTLGSAQYRIPKTAVDVTAKSGAFTNMGDTVTFETSTSIPNYSSQKAGLANKDFYPFFTVTNSYSRNYDNPKLEAVGVYLGSETGTQLIKDKDYTINSVEVGDKANPSFTIDLNPVTDGKRESGETGHGKNLLDWQGKKLIIKYDVKVKNVDTNADLSASAVTKSTESSGGDATAQSNVIKIASLTLNTTGKDGVASRNGRFEITPSSNDAKDYKISSKNGQITSCSSDNESPQSCGGKVTMSTKNGSLTLTGLAQGINVTNSDTNSGGNRNFTYHFKEVTEGKGRVSFNLKVWPVYNPNTPTFPKIMYQVTDSTDEDSVENTKEMQLPVSSDNVNYLESDTGHTVVVKPSAVQNTEPTTVAPVDQKPMIVRYAVVFGIVLVVCAIVSKIRSGAAHKRAIKEARDLRKRW